MIIAFSNRKGGVAKTSSTVNIGAALRELNHSVALFDIDPQENCGGASVIEAATAHDALHGAWARGFDFRLIDCPPSFNAESRAALALADMVCIPLEPQGFAVEGLAKLLATIHESQSRGRDLQYRVLLTMCDARKKEQREFEVQIRDALGALVLQATIPRAAAVEQANNRRVSVLEHAPKCAAANAYRAAAKELTG